MKLPLVTASTGLKTMHPSIDADDNDDSGLDIVLSREDYDLLHAFHRLIPLPALSSGVTRILCDEDLQVPDDDDVSSATTTKRKSHVETLRHLRLADSAPLAASSKPRRDVDLGKMTPRQGELRPETS